MPGGTRRFRAGWERHGFKPRALRPELTPEEWAECDWPAPMIWTIRGRASARKLRLFACACYRSPDVWEALSEREALCGQEDLKAMLLACERAADGLGPLPDIPRGSFPPAEPDPVRAAETAAWEASGDASERGLVGVNPEDCSGDLLDIFNSQFEAEVDQQLRLIRCLFGNPFQPAVLDPGWRTGDVVALARNAYNDRTWDRLPQLADALEAAGCENTDVLEHCRGPGPHARGCWVVDLVLGYE